MCEVKYVLNVLMSYSVVRLMHHLFYVNPIHIPFNVIFHWFVNVLSRVLGSPSFGWKNACLCFILCYLMVGGLHGRARMEVSPGGAECWVPSNERVPHTRSQLLEGSPQSLASCRFLGLWLISYLAQCWYKLCVCMHVCVSVCVCLCVYVRVKMCKQACKLW